MNAVAAERFIDIPESAMQNRPLNGIVLGSDGIWDDFCSEAAEIIDGSNLIPNESIEPVTEQRVQDFPVSIANLQEIPLPNIPVRSRNVLSSQKAKDIFTCLLAGIDDRPGSSVFLSAHYGVSPKTIRDIWNR